MVRKNHASKSYVNLDLYFQHEGGLEMSKEITMMNEADSQIMHSKRQQTLKEGKEGRKPLNGNKRKSHWNVSRLAHTGLETENTSFFLKELKKGCDWKQALEALYSAKQVYSLKRAGEIAGEVKRRIGSIRTLTSDPLLPDMPNLIEIAGSNLNSKIKAEIYLVYLYYSDELFAKILDSIKDFYQNAGPNEPIRHKTIKSIIQQILENQDISERVINNWIGKFLSTLKETQIIILMKNREYLINFGRVSEEAFTFFLLWSHFNKIDFSLSPLFRVFYIQPTNILDLLKLTREKHWIKYQEDQLRIDQVNSLKIITPYSSISEWLGEFK